MVAPTLEWRTPEPREANFCIAFGGFTDKSRRSNALAQDRGCTELLQLIAAARGGMGSLMGEVVEDHVRFHIVDPAQKPSTKEAESAQQLIDVLKPYRR